MAAALVRRPFLVSEYMPMDYRGFFGLANNGLVPFNYQVRLATEPIEDRVIRVPTGGGKTAAAVLAWLWKRYNNVKHTPTRLFYFLPTRTLVRQTHDAVKGWVEQVGMSDAVRVYELLGGDPDLKDVQKEWMLNPEKSAVLVGTVDMMLSAALNRGYAMSRYRWPVAFGLINNDALWVIDETQLMGNAVATFSQLAYFHSVFGTTDPVYLWWMSATEEPNWLTTVDYTEAPKCFPADIKRLRQDLGERYTAPKPLRGLKGTLDAKTVLAMHRPATLTIVVRNTVKGAQQLYRELLRQLELPERRKLTKEAKLKPELLLLHSRFRHAERGEKTQRLTAADLVLRGKETDFGDRVWLDHVRRSGLLVVATQVVEAGLDISADTLITDLAPWPSMVQRFGRLNRFGKQGAAQAVWVDVKSTEAAPYTALELDAARERLKKLTEVSPNCLDKVPLPVPRRPEYVIRQHDLHSLFWTERDLAGGFTDVSEYIRDTQERDVYVFWRDYRGHPNRGEGQAQAEARELCPVPLNGLREFLANAACWRWDGSGGRWVRMRSRSIVSGMTVMLDCADGGYSSEEGWTGDGEHRPNPIGDGRTRDSDNADSWSETGWYPLAQHLFDCEEEVRRIAGQLEWAEAHRESLAKAARWHDIGKAHPAWQTAVERTVSSYRKGVWAKFPAQKNKRFRPKMRHEEASALCAYHEWVSEQAGWDALAVYLVASHHGKIRTALGTYAQEGRTMLDGEIQLEGWLEHPVRLRTELLAFTAPVTWNDNLTVTIEKPSWTELVDTLIGPEEPQRPDGAFGPFRLAALEALLVAADAIASQKRGGGDCGKP